MRRGTDTDAQTHRQTRVTSIHFASSTTVRLTRNVIISFESYCLDTHTHTHTHTHDRVLYLDNYSGQQKMLQYIPVSAVRGIERRHIIARQSFDPARLCGRTGAGWVRSDTVITGGCHDAA